MSNIPVNTISKEDYQVRIVPLGDEMNYDFRRPHRHEYFEFFVFTKGGGSHFIDFTEHVIKPFSVHIVFPSQIHLLKRSGARGQIIICKKEFINTMDRLIYSQVFQNNYTAPVINFDEQKFDTVSSIVSALGSELTEQGPLSIELSRNYLSIFLSHCIRNFRSIENTDDRKGHDIEVFRKFTLLLEQYFLEKQNVNFYAHEMAMTPKALNNSLKKVAGQTCIELVQERTLTEAKRLLLYTDQSSKEIAFALNFKDNSYFTRFFTKLQGQTPLAFKNYWEEKYHS